MITLDDIKAMVAEDTTTIRRMRRIYASVSEDLDDLSSVLGEASRIRNEIADKLDRLNG